jgi:hypothetical protein
MRSARRPFYPEHIAKSYIDLQNERVTNRNKVREGRKIDKENALILHNNAKKLRGNPTCITGVSVAYCNQNHFFYKPVHCGKENCTFCGEDKSPAHLRRVSRVSDVVMSWEAVSYLVITIPEACRDYFRSKVYLNEFRTFIRRKLKRDGFTQAVFRWHWAGSCKECKGIKAKRQFCETCKGTGAGNVYEPHLNILMPAGNTNRTTKAGKVKTAVNCYDVGKHTLKADYCEAFKNSLQEWFLKHTGKEVTGNIYHNFIGPRDPAKKRKVKHRLRYVFRATLRDENLFQECLFLKGYRNTIHLGKIERKKEDLPICCPLCNNVLRWYGEPREKWFEPGKRERLIEIDAGLYYLNLIEENEKNIN